MQNFLRVASVSAFWRRALIPLFSLLLITLLAWAIVGVLPALIFLVLGLLVRVLFHLHRLAGLDSWLNDPEGLPAPDSTGIWGEVYSRLHKMVRKQLQDRERRIAALQDMEQATSALPEGVIILDDADRIEWCNPLAEKHFGLAHVRDVGQQITYLARQPEFVHYLAKKDFSNPLVLRGSRHDGLVLSIKLVCYGDNKKLLISRDITHFERVETMRRDFVANVSHELRTPLTVVNGFVETLHDMPNLENDMSRRALHLMGEQTYRMAHLVDDLLTLSRLENELNVLHEENVEVPKLVYALQQEGKSLSNGQHVLRTEVDSDCGVIGSAAELHSAFGNLVSNAVRYTPPGGEIILRWQVRDGKPVFSVQDSGIGIAPKYIPRLTERFYRVDRSRSRETGGTGLGLAIVKHVANRHQAQLDVASEEGRGSTFSIIFPAKRCWPQPVKTDSQ
jgi:two-component system, OmpR family, phosphate regulon sensor histidine kinase PhoR